MKSNDLEKSKKRRKEGKEDEERRRKREEERTGEKKSTQPSILSLTILMKLNFFPINNVLHLVIAINTIHKKRTIQ